MDANVCWMMINLGWGGRVAWEAWEHRSMEEVDSKAWVRHSTCYLLRYLSYLVLCTIPVLYSRSLVDSCTGTNILQDYTSIPIIYLTTVCMYCTSCARVDWAEAKVPDFHPVLA